MRTFLAMTASLALAGCLVGGTDSDPGTGTPGEPSPVVPDPGTPLPPVSAAEAKALFDTNVAPIMEAKCTGTGTGCHVGTAVFPPPFLGTGPIEEYYPSLVADTAVNGNFKVQSARLVVKVSGGAHAGVTYTQDDLNKVSEWLNAELSARNPGETPGAVPPPPAVNVLAQWAGCMNLEDWNQTNMGSWASKGSNEGNCSACHNQGLARFNTNDNDNTMFEANRFEIFISGFFAVEVDPVSGETLVVPATDKLVYMGSGQPGNLHPRYNTDPDDNRFQRLQQFYNLTKARVDEQGNPRCAPPAFPEGRPPL